MKLPLTLVALTLAAAQAFSAEPGGSTSSNIPGAALFRIHCAQCHGNNGEGGRGPVLAVATLRRAPSDEALERVIMLGVPATEMPGFFLPTEQVQQLVRHVRELGRQPAPSVMGDATRGAELYRTKGNCASCHSIRGQGGVVGPDLTEIGARRGAGHLRQSLVEPEASIPENFNQYRWHTVIPDNYLQVRAVTKAGREIAGARLNEDPFTIQVRDVAGGFHSLVKTELAALHKDWGKSVMPSYRDVFTAAELDDVVAYLLTLKGTP
jgi:cytochrome c oxidase cbb3-type subunit 3